MSQRNASSTSIIETVAGLTAGVVSTLTLHPLDLIKTRLQIDRLTRHRVGSSLRITSEIYRTEGGLRALYRGLTPNIIGNSTSWSLYFLFYGNIKEAIARGRVRHEDEPDGEEKNGKGDKLSASEYFLASGAAGALTSILTNPIWVIKTRMLSTGSHTPGAYQSFVSGATQILRTEGIPGFYRGLVPALFGVSHGAFQFMAYEKLKSYRLRLSSPPPPSGSGERKEDFTNVELLLISGLSKTFAGCITYPYQVLRTRLQLQAYNADASSTKTAMARSTYRGVWDATRQIWAQEGLSGFYKGLGPSLVRVLPSTWVVFLVYENTKAAMYRI